MSVLNFMFELDNGQKDVDVNAKIDDKEEMDQLKKLNRHEITGAKFVNVNAKSGSDLIKESKLHSDPLYLLKKEQIHQRNKILLNEYKMKKIKRSVKERKAEKKERKKRKKKRKQKLRDQKLKELLLKSFSDKQTEPSKRRQESSDSDSDRSYSNDSRYRSRSRSRSYSRSPHRHRRRREDDHRRHRSRKSSDHHRSRRKRSRSYDRSHSRSRSPRSESPKSPRHRISKKVNDQSTESNHSSRKSSKKFGLILSDSKHCGVRTQNTRRNRDETNNHNSSMNHRKPGDLDRRNGRDTNSDYRNPHRSDRSSSRREQNEDDEAVLRQMMEAANEHDARRRDRGRKHDHRRKVEREVEDKEKKERDGKYLKDMESKLYVQHSDTLESRLKKNVHTRMRRDKL